MLLNFFTYPTGNVRINVSVWNQKKKKMAISYGSVVMRNEPERDEKLGTLRLILTGLSGHELAWN